MNTGKEVVPSPFEEVIIRETPDDVTIYKMLLIALEKIILVLFTHFVDNNFGEAIRIGKLKYLCFQLILL